MNLRSARKIFLRSPATFRPMARWIWNDHLDTEHLSQQLDRMLDLGLGGAMIRPGAGLPAGAYLGEHWFEAVYAVAKRARRRRASLWIAEDFDDPFTQTTVDAMLRESPNRAACLLKMEDLLPGAVPAPLTGKGEIVAIFEVLRETPSAAAKRRDPAMLRRLAPGPADQALASRRLVFRSSPASGRLSGFHPGATLDLLDRTHARYHVHARKYFGNTIGLCLILGADAPRLPGSAPWDPEMPALFQETHGYPLLDNLPALFFDLPGCETVRADFWAQVNDMLDEGFTRPFARWAQEHSIPHASTLRHAGDLRNAVANGAHAMTRYAVHTFPALVGPDSQTHGDEDAAHDAVAHIEARSVKRQLSMEGVAEIATAPGVSAWDRFAQGVSFFAGHTVLASLRGTRKHAAYRPFVLANEAGAVARAEFDAQARLAWMLGQGRAAAKVLLLHPHTSLQTAYRVAEPGGESPMNEAIVRHFVAITQALIAARVEFDYGDEAVLATHATAHQRALSVGAAEYRVFVLPPLLNLRASTADLLHDFATGGGLVLAVGSLPEWIDGRRSDRMLKFFEEYGERIVQGVDFGRYQALIDRLARAHAVERVEGPAGLRIDRSTWDEIEMIALHNAGDLPAKWTLDFSSVVSGRAECWNLTTGGPAELAPAIAGQSLGQPLGLPPGASALIVVVPDEAEVASPTRFTEESRLTPLWTARRASPNVAALRQCRVAEPRASNEWIGLASARANLESRIAKYRGPVSMRTLWRFRVTDGAPSIAGCAVVAELSEGASMKLDGKDLSIVAGENELDAALRSASLPTLAPGEHVLEVWTLYATVADFQPPWLRGPFEETIEQDGGLKITRARETLALGPLAPQGLAHYFGDLVYSARVDGSITNEARRVELQFTGLSQPAKVRVDGTHAGIVLAAQPSLDLSGAWHAGARTIDVVLTITPGAILAASADEPASSPANGLDVSPQLVTFNRKQEQE